MATRRLLEVQYKPGEELVFRFNTQRLRLLPEATQGHLRNANREFLLALRSIIDRAVERADGAETGRGRRRQRVQVEEEPPRQRRGRRRVQVEEQG